MIGVTKLTFRSRRFRRLVAQLLERNQRKARAYTLDHLARSGFQSIAILYVFFSFQPSRFSRPTMNCAHDDPALRTIDRPFVLCDRGLLVEEIEFELCGCFGAQET